MTLDQTRSPAQIAAAEVIRLARLTPLDYELCRRQKAAELRLRVGVLDALVELEQDRQYQARHSLQSRYRARVAAEIRRVESSPSPPVPQPLQQRRRRL